MIFNEISDNNVHEVLFKNKTFNLLSSRVATVLVYEKES